jgi:predicted dehydrogenase
MTEKERINMSVRIGIIGAGRMGNLHTGHLLKNPDAAIVAAADILPERAEALAARTGGKAYTDYRQMLDKEQLDAVYVCTPTRGHAEHAVAVAERKLALFVEKPLAATMTEGWQIARAVQQAGIINCVDYQWRYTEAVIKAREILGDKPLAAVVAQWFWTIPPIPWLRDKDQGLGQVVDQTTHLTDLCLLFAGVYAAYTLNTFTDAEFHNWDGFSLAWKHIGGAVGSLQGTYALFPTIGQFEPPSLKLIGRELLLRLTLDGLAVITPAGQEDYRNSGPLHVNVTAAFVSAVAQGSAAPIRSGVAETLSSLAFTLAANESAVTGNPVDVRLLIERGR